MGYRKLFVDTQRGRLVESDTSQQDATLRPFVQGDTESLEVTFLVPKIGGSRTEPYSKVDITGHSLRVGLVRGGASPIAQQIPSGFTVDSTGTKFTGTLSLNTSEVNTELSGGDTTIPLEIELTDGSGNAMTFVQRTVQLKEEGLNPTSSVPTPVEEYYTKDVANQTFVKREMDAGQGFIMKAADGTSVFIFIDSNYTLQASPLS